MQLGRLLCRHSMHSSDITGKALEAFRFALEFITVTSPLPLQGTKSLLLLLLLPLRLSLPPSSSTEGLVQVKERDSLPVVKRKGSTPSPFCLTVTWDLISNPDTQNCETAQFRPVTLRGNDLNNSFGNETHFN